MTEKKKPIENDDKEIKPVSKKEVVEEIAKKPEEVKLPEVFFLEMNPEIHKNLRIFMARVANDKSGTISEYPAYEACMKAILHPFTTEGVVAYAAAKAKSSEEQKSKEEKSKE